MTQSLECTGLFHVCLAPLPLMSAIPSSSPLSTAIFMDAARPHLCSVVSFAPSHTLPFTQKTLSLCFQIVFSPQYLKLWLSILITSKATCGKQKRSPSGWQHEGLDGVWLNKKTNGEKNVIRLFTFFFSKLKWVFCSQCLHYRRKGKKRLLQHDLSCVLIWSGFSGWIWLP